GLFQTGDVREQVGACRALLLDAQQQLLEGEAEAFHRAPPGADCSDPRPGGQPPAGKTSPPNPPHPCRRGGLGGSVIAARVTIESSSISPSPRRRGGRGVRSWNGLDAISASAAHVACRIGAGVIGSPRTDTNEPAGQLRGASA